MTTRLVHLVDNVEYATSNCWQHQLFSKLRSSFDNVATVTIADIIHGWHPHKDDVMFSTMRLRTLDARRNSVAIALHNHPVICYEQDPWEDFVDQGSCSGAYERITAAMNVQTFVNTSKWWTEFVRSKGYKSEFVKMWVQPEYCSSDPIWSERPIKIGYKGCPRPDRITSINNLRALGLDVHVDTLPESYDKFLSKLSQMRVFFHEESRDSWTIDGNPIRRECCWAKEIEIVARGCIALRQHEDESSAYLCDTLPAVITYEDTREIPQIVSRLERNHRYTDEICATSVDRVRKIEPWSDLVCLLREACK